MHDAGRQETSPVACCESLDSCGRAEVTLTGCGGDSENVLAYAGSEATEAVSGHPYVISQIKLTFQSGIRDIERIDVLGRTYRIFSQQRYCNQVVVDARAPVLCGGQIASLWEMDCSEDTCSESSEARQVSPGVLIHIEHELTQRQTRDDVSSQQSVNRIYYQWSPECLDDRYYFHAFDARCGKKVWYRVFSIHDDDTHDKMPYATAVAAAVDMDRITGNNSQSTVGTESKYGLRPLRPAI